MNLKELSSHLGLSQTTVSRALNGFPEVKEATRLRVREAAATYGYRPNTRAKSLATGQSFTIGHVIPSSTNHELVNPIFADFLAGASETYEREGYDLLLSMVSDHDEERAYREFAARGKVDGVIVHGPTLSDSRVKLLQELNLPFVVHGRSSRLVQDYNWLDVNNRRAFNRATGFLLDLGHRRIALLNGLESMDFAMRRREGYSSALKDRGIAEVSEFVAHDEMTEVFGYVSTKSMLKAFNPPTAFLVSSIIPAIGARRAIEETGQQLGKDVSIVVFDDDLSYFRNSGDIPFFTAVRSSVRTGGRIAAEMLLEIIRVRPKEPRQTLLEAELTVGLSTGPAPKRDDG
ncbi:MAG: LacI family DNA-binding transcriptional regulator [Boseongicola sp.]